MLEKFKNFWKKAWWSKAIVIFVVIMLIGMIVPADDSEESTSSQDQTVEKKPSVITVKNGESVKIGNFEIRTMPASCSKSLVFTGRGWGGDKTTSKASKGEFVFADVYAKNVSKKAAENNIELTDVKLLVNDVVYNTDDDLMSEYSTDGRVFKQEEVNPGMEQSARFGFDIPEGTFKNSASMYLTFKVNDQKYKLQIK